MARFSFDRGFIIPALITPYKSDGSLNLVALEQLVDALISEGVKGFYVSGSTGEAFLQTVEERKAIASTVAQKAKGKAHVIFHVGSIATHQAVELAKFAQDIGIDEISSLPPFYYKFSKEEITNYYEAILDSCSKPLIIYNIPVLTGISMTNTCPHLFEHPNVSGIKHTTSDFYEFRNLKTKYPHLTLFSGFDEMGLAGLSMGSDGMIGSTFNYQAKLFFDLVESYKSGDTLKALSLQDKANKTISTILSTGLYNSIRYLITKKYGIDVGESRKPFAPLTKESKAILDQLPI